LKLKCDEPPSKFTFNFNLRRYTLGSAAAAGRNAAARANAAADVNAAMESGGGGPQLESSIASVSCLHSDQTPAERAEVLAAFRALTRGTAKSGGGGASVLVVADACLPSVAAGEAPLGQGMTVCS
jgi:hypothetical protein